MGKSQMGERGEGKGPAACGRTHRGVELGREAEEGSVETGWGWGSGGIRHRMENKPTHFRTPPHIPSSYTHPTPHIPHLTQHTHHTPYVHTTVSPSHCIYLLVHTYKSPHTCTSHSQSPTSHTSTFLHTHSLVHPPSRSPALTHTPSHSYLSLTHSWALSMTQRPWRVQGGGP